MLITKNNTLRIDQLLHFLVDNGYQRTLDVANFGEFHRLGSIFTVWPVDFENPIFLDFFGNTVERIAIIDTISQKIKKMINSITIPSNILIVDAEKIKPNDYIVHLDCGIARFCGFCLKKVDGGKNNNYINLEFDKEEHLYLPIDKKDKITPYLGVGLRRPRLSHLGSGSWSNTKRKVSASIYQLAKELLLVAAERKLQGGHTINGNKDWQKKLSASFPFVETTDQENAINDVLSDLKKPLPMDRLVVGDVGFGKTEVALRALLQAVSSGYQVAFLAPTTLLVEQHYVNFKKRLDDFPIRLMKLSRLSPSRTDDISEIEKGTVDAIIGTHQLLSPKIKFKNLGLVIIDEEQKFGVAQKEKLKKIRQTVDVLALSATPIPRTLFTALSGLKEISKIETAPHGRLAIKTEVAKFDEKLVDYYLNRELSRDGQVYYLHNNVATISALSYNLQKRYPRIKVISAHGQMNKDELSGNMSLFAENHAQILVCSSIIENGLDLPNVNTLIIDNAERFGLTDLYQIRGRIGRSDLQAYSLFLTGNFHLTDNASKRLETLKKHTAIGSGFKIALRDLEIRGGGNLLGREQHGNMEAVGLLLYTKLLEQTVKKVNATPADARHES